MANPRVKIFKFSMFLLILFGIFVSCIYFQSLNGRKVKQANLEIQEEKLKNAIKIFKALDGSYPDLNGNENSLVEVKTDKGVSFAYIYGSDKLESLPESRKKSVKESNKITSKKTDTGGWHYIKETGLIEPNMPENPYK